VAIEIGHGWPACGKLYAYKAIFSSFWKSLKTRMTRGRWGKISESPIYHEGAEETTAPRFIGITAAADDGAPISQLLTFELSVPPSSLRHFPVERPN
jgi:hypothetical protein